MNCDLYLSEYVQWGKKRRNKYKQRKKSYIIGKQKQKSGRKKGNWNTFQYIDKSQLSSVIIIGVHRNEIWKKEKFFNKKQSFGVLFHQSKGALFIIGKL